MRNAVALAALLATTTPLEPAGAASCTNVRRYAAWSRVAAPAVVRRYAVDPRDPRLLLVTDGTSVWRSADGGCVWRQVWTGTGVRVRDLALGGQGRAYVLGHATSAVPAPVVLASSDGGATWRPGGTGLPAVAGLGAADQPRLLAVSPNVPAVAYAVFCTPVVNCRLPVVYGTDDGGATWTERGPLPERGSYATAGWAGAVTVDPRDHRRLWATTAVAEPLFSSGDGGRTWTRRGQVLPGLADFAIHVDRSRRATLVGLAADRQLLTSADDAASWRSRPLAGLALPRTVAVGGRATSIAVLHTDGYDTEFEPVEVLRLDPRRGWQAITPGPRPDGYRLTADRSARPSLWLNGGDALWRFTGQW